MPRQQEKYSAKNAKYYASCSFCCKLRHKGNLTKTTVTSENDGERRICLICIHCALHLYKEARDGKGLLSK